MMTNVGGSDAKESACNAGDQVRSLGWEPTPVFLPGKSYGWRSLEGYNPWGCKELETTERLHFNVMNGKTLCNNFRGRYCT